jgi:hypothetical protein
MPKLACRILVINDEQLVLREFVKGLNAAARALDNPLGISFTGVTTAQEALGVIEADGDLQAVLVDDTLYSLERNNGKKQLQMSASSPSRSTATSTARSATIAGSTASSTPRSRSARARLFTMRSRITCGWRRTSGTPPDTPRASRCAAVRG